MRAFFGACGATSFPHGRLSPASIKHYVVELYAATVSRLSRSLLKAVGAGAGAEAVGGRGRGRLRVLHAGLDLWTSDTTSDRWIGERR